MAGSAGGAQLRAATTLRSVGMGKLLFMGVRGSADPTNAAMPFIMANGAKQAGHEAQIVLANEAVDLMTSPVLENLVGGQRRQFLEETTAISSAQITAARPPARSDAEVD